MSRKDRSTHRLLMRSDQLELMDRSLEQQAVERTEQEEADERRRAEYLERLRAALPELRKLEGFPIGTDEDILALSDPPYYTACPNPFLGEFIAEHGTPYDEATDDYHREPFAADVSEGKNDPIYNAHSYHTKVPHKAIMRYILHYTKPGDIVFDGFCGSGMTGVAAQLCGSPDPEFRARVEAEWAAAGHEPPQWGVRKAILGDLSPAATFIAYNLNGHTGGENFRQSAEQFVQSVRSGLPDVYADASSGSVRSETNYVLWTDVFICPTCENDVAWWDAVVLPDFTLREPKCPTCGYQGSDLKSRRRTESFLDPYLGIVRTRSRQVPILSDATGPNGRFKRRPEWAEDNTVAADTWVPTDLLPAGMNTRQPAVSHGAERVHDFWTPRNLRVLSSLFAAARMHRHHFAMMSLLTSFMVKTGSRLHNVGFKNGSLNLAGQVPNTLFLPSISAERNLFVLALSKSATLSPIHELATQKDSVRITCQSNTDAYSFAPESVDYIFTDPPFGGNINYSEVSFLWEAWLRVHTNNTSEAITNDSQGKHLLDYQRLMEEAFKRNLRALKPGRWMTVEFHNSSNAVWNAIQEAVQRAGFVVADVRMLDKKQGTFKQMTTAGAVKQDLVISAYKPRAGFERTFSIEAGSEQGAWDFVRQHLEQLPVFVERAGRVEVIAERQNYLLYDRMIAFHIQRGATIPLSAGDFYRGLRERFVERDDMYFTVSQAADYDRRRMEAREIEQLSVFVVDEKSAIQWVRAELAAQPQTFQDLTPKFLRELNKNRFEEMPELRDILAQNFLEDPDTHRWRVPDPARQADLEALRTRELLNEFGAYLGGTARLKRFRLEAVRAGIADLWSKRDYKAIIKLCERLPDEVVQEDTALLMYYDNAVMRQGAG